jgi:anti-anti-sigma regulatory factor
MLQEVRFDEPPRATNGEVVISVRRDSDATVISAMGSVDVALLADLANAARLVSIDGPVILDLSKVELLDAASAALVATWCETGIHGGPVLVTTVGIAVADDVPAAWSDPRLVLGGPSID